MNERKVPPDLDTLSVRTRNALKNNFKGDFSVDDVANLTRAQIMRVPNFGKKSLREAVVWLHSHGLEFSVPNSEIRSVEDYSDVVLDEKTLASIDLTVSEFKARLLRGARVRVKKENQRKSYPIRSSKNTLTIIQSTDRLVEIAERMLEGENLKEIKLSLGCPPYGSRIEDALRKLASDILTPSDAYPQKYINNEYAQGYVSLNEQLRLAKMLNWGKPTDD